MVELCTRVSLCTVGLINRSLCARVLVTKMQLRVFVAIGTVNFVWTSESWCPAGEPCKVLQHICDGARRSLSLWSFALCSRDRAIAAISITHAVHHNICVYIQSQYDSVQGIPNQTGFVFC